MLRLRQHLMMGSMLERQKRSGRATLGLAACMLVPAAIAVGAARAETGPLPPAQPAASARVEQKLYFVRDGKLAVARRSVPLSPTPAADSLRRLFAGPTASERRSGLTTRIPSGSAVRWVRKCGNVASVNLSARFAPGGTLALNAQLAQVVFTLTQFPTLKLVRFFIDGKETQAAGSSPSRRFRVLGRHAFASYLPAIFLESPGASQRVRSPLLIEGSAAGTILATVVGSDGKLLAQKLLLSRATTRTRFEVKLGFRLSVEEKGRLIVFKLDGANTITQIELPLTLVP